MHIEFQTCGNIGKEAQNIAEDIAYSADSEEEAWECVRDLQCADKCGRCEGCADCEAIYSVGSFVEFE